MIRCLIVDDEPVARGIVRHYCGHLPFLEIVAECANAFEAKDKLASDDIDLVFLDINMPALSGIGLLNTLRRPPVVIFTTAYEEYAVQAFDLAACDYLLKPFSLERFMIAVDRAQAKLQPYSPVAATEEPDSFFIKADGKHVRVAFDDCLYIEAQGNYCKVVTTKATLSTKVPLTELLSLLPKAVFLRVHRSFIVNKNKVSHIDGNRVFVQEYEVPVTGGYKNELFTAVGIKN